MSALDEVSFFASQLVAGATDVGAVLPTSKFAARAMVAEIARTTGPRRILEVGCGTGPITAELVKILGPDDRLILCDINAPFIDYIRRRFEKEAEFVAVRDQVELYDCSVTDLPEEPAYDFIVSALPFTRLGETLTREILAKYERMLTPDGVLTYIEYAYLRSVKDAVTGSSNSASIVVDELLRKHEFRRDTVWRNAPPAWVHHLRFLPARLAFARRILPMAHNQRFTLGQMTFDGDAARFMLGSALLAWILARFSRRMPWPLALAAGVAGAWFLRDPDRSAAATDATEDSIYSACDGRVIAIERVHDARFGEGDWLRIAAFLDVTDVHMNRSPVAGKVINVIREPGGHAVASGSNAESNESTYTVVESVSGHTVVVAQRVGAIARRIVNRARPGSLIARGEKFGLIRFGSRTDVYLPFEHTACLIQVGDVIVGGETKIASFS